MAIPDFQSIMLPLIQFASDGQEHSSRESIDYLASYFGLTEDKKKELLPSGKQPIFSNGVGWSKTDYLCSGKTIDFDYFSDE